MQKFAYVAWPRVLAEQLQGRRTNSFVRAESLVEHGCEVLCQERHIIASCAQRWYLHRDGTKAVEQILAKKVGRDAEGPNSKEWRVGRRTR